MSTVEPIYVQPPRGRMPKEVAVIGGNYQGEGELAFAFRAAADVVVAFWREDASATDDSVLVPALYNYRHALELFLKMAIGMILTAADLMTDGNLPLHMEKARKGLSSTHSLQGLADQLIAGANDLEIPLEDSMLTLLSAMHDIDKTGQSLRYVHDKVNGALQAVRPEPVFLNMARTAERCGDACDDLDSLVDYLGDVHDGLLGQLEYRH